MLLGEFLDAEYECHKCGRVFSGEDFSKSKFCPHDWTYLRPKRVKGAHPRSKDSAIPPVELTREQINIATLFDEFMRLQHINAGEGVFFDDVPSWITERKKAYSTFRDKFRQNKLIDWEKLSEDFKEFLYFKNNMSWTTLYRAGLSALSELEKLWKLLTFLQNESVDVQLRVNEGLKGGKYYCHGIGRNILTAILHVFYTDKYGVWNSRTEHTLYLIRRMPKTTFDIGQNYKLVNNELKHLAAELSTDMTTVDSFMWFISKKVRLIR